MPLRLFLALAAFAPPAVTDAPPPGSAPAASAPSLNCDKGPLNRTFGGTAWLVYGCEDGKTLVVAAREGNPAAPFYFILYPKGDGHGLYGEGIGDKKATAPAFEDLKRLDSAAIAALVAEAEQAGAARAPLAAEAGVPATRALLKQPNLFADLDYPPAALRAGHEGTVGFELEIGPNGRAMRCSILASSGSAILDSETCRMIRLRARFTPALDAEGRTTWDSRRGETVWRLPL